MYSQLGRSDMTKTVMRANFAATWAALAAVVSWIRSRAGRSGAATVSQDWLLELERKSIRGEY